MEKLARENEVVGIYISGHPLDDFKLEMQNFCNGDISVFRDLPGFLNKEISFGGVVTDVQHRVSKQGKGWGTFVIEDYMNSHEFRIFGEEYLKFKHFLMHNNFVFVRTLIKEGWTNRETGAKGEPRLQFNSFQLLHDIMESYAKKLSIQLNIKEVSEDKIQSLKELLQMHSGNHALKFVVYDDDDELKLEMSSRLQKIKISQELLEEQKSQEVFYKLN